MKQVIGLGLPEGLLNVLTSKGSEMPTLIKALSEIDKAAGKMAEAVDKSETKEQAEEALNNIAEDAGAALNKLFDEADEKEATRNSKPAMDVSDDFGDFLNKVVPGMFENMLPEEKEEEDCGCEALAEQTLFFSDVIERLEAGEVAVSMNVPGLLIVRTEDGGLMQENGQPIVVTPELLGSVFDIVSKPSELIAVPMHVALQAFQQGATIVLEYKDMMNSPDDIVSVEINPSVPESQRPFVHFDAVAHGIYYIKQN